MTSATIIGLLVLVAVVLWRQGERKYAAIAAVVALALLAPNMLGGLIAAAGNSPIVQAVMGLVIVIVSFLLILGIGPLRDFFSSRRD